jgi:hypothetical protein
MIMMATNASAAPFTGNNDGLMNVQVLNTTGTHPGTSTPNWLQIWNNIDANPTATGVMGTGNWNVQNNSRDTETNFNYGTQENFGPPNPAINSINGDGPGITGPVGPFNGGDNYSIRAKAFLQFTTAGTYTISMGSDDGTRIELTGVTLKSGSPFNGFDIRQDDGGDPNDVNGAFSPGDTVIGFDGGRGHNHTMGTFSVAAGDLLELDAFYYEGGGGDSGELSITNIATGTFTTGGLNPFVLLADGALGGAVQISSLAVETPEPASLALWSILGLSAAGFGIVRYRRGRRQ